MRLVVTLLVRDEEDIVALNVGYHLESGADLVIVTDNGSVDGTVDALAPFVAARYVRLIEEPAPTHSQWRWVTRMARLAAIEYDADWVINTDADEFWIPATGKLPDALAAVPDEYVAAEVPRFNFRPVAGVGGGPLQTTMREVASQRFIGGALESKLCHRASREALIGQGNHEVHRPQGPVWDASGVLRIFHYPQRSREQFRKSVGNAGAAYASSDEFVSSTGEVKRHLYAEMEAGRLDDLFAEYEVDETELGRLLAVSTVVEDDTLVTRLGALEPPSAPEVRYDVGVGAGVGVVPLQGGHAVVRLPDPVVYALERSRVETIDAEVAVLDWLAAAADGLVHADSFEMAGVGNALQEGIAGGGAMALAASLYRQLRAGADLDLVRPTLALLNAVRDDPWAASRLAGYLAPLEADDPVAELTQRLSGAEASLEQLMGRQSVKAALAASDLAARLRARR